MVTVDSRVFQWLGVKVFWRLTRWELIWRADPEVNKYCFLVVVWYSLTGKCKTVSAQRAELVIAGEEDHNCSSSDLSGFKFKLLWDCVLRIWVPAVNSGTKLHLFTDFSHC